MKRRHAVIYRTLVLLPLLCPILLCAQHVAAAATTDSSQGRMILYRAGASANGSAAITDVTLTGTVRHISGAEEDTGTATLQALTSGETRVEFNLSSGRSVETRFNTPKGFVGKWVGPDGVTHDVPRHNLISEPAWFAPYILLSRLSSTPDITVSDAKSEVKNNRKVTHLTAGRQVTDKKLQRRVAEMIELSSRIELYLDEATLLPSTLTFTTHPDNNGAVNIPVEIRYSDYRTVRGATVPFHVQEFVNDTLIFDLVFESVTFNSGLNAASFEGN